MRLLFVLLLLVAVQAQAAHSFLGMCHKDWNCDATVKLYDSQERVILSYLENTFGTKCACVNRLLDSPKPKILRVHLIQSPCMRNKRCGRYEALWGYTAASGSRAAQNPKSRLRKRFTRILETFRRRIEGKELTCYVSPCLECDLYEPARRVLANLVSASLPNCTIVDNPYRRRCLAGYVCEKHGPNPTLSAPCIVDLDGVDGATIDVKKYVEQYRHCDLTYYWEAWMNCNTVNPSQFIDPRKRDCASPPKTFAKSREILCQYFYPLSDTCLL